MIKLFSKKDCSKCSDIKEFMRSKNVEFEELPLDIDDNLAYLIEHDIDISEAPILEKDNKFYTNKTSGLTRAILGK